MPKRNVSILLIFVIVGLFWFLGFFDEPKRANILVFSKTAGYRHESIEAGIEAIRKLGQQYNFSAAFSEDANIFREDFLKNVHAVVFLNTTADVLDSKQQSHMERFIQAGGGFVGIHAAADTEYDWQWYGKLVGAYFESHPNNPNIRNAVIQIVNKSHTATDSLPQRWQRDDEWYNYKYVNADINVLMKLDESSYEGGTNEENHPIAWYHEYDGGRAFYTGLGHTAESYTDPLFLKHLLGGIQYAVGNSTLDYSKAYSEAVPEENRFVKVALEEGLAEPMELDFLSDDKIIFVERRGNVKIFDLQKGKSQVIGRFNVFSKLEDGLLGVAVDPNYHKNQWVYFFYSPEGNSPKQCVSRLRLVGDTLDISTEKILLEIPVQREECCHSAGALEFDDQGNLFISIGDNTNPHFSSGYNPIDERAGRVPFDAQKSSANSNDLRGKILRIKPEADGSYSIPDGNLFPKDGSRGRPEIYVMGCRNPYRYSIDSKTGYLYWGDVGPDARKDSIGRGARGYDEINRAKAPGFFGWPYFIGNNKPYRDYNFADKVSGAAFNPQKPVNNSPNNTGIKHLPPAQPALVWYPYGESEEFPIVGSGSRNAMAGPVYYYDDYPEGGKKFPAFFDGKLLVYDWMRQWILAASFDKQEHLKKLTPFVPNMPFSNIIDMAFNTKGELYLLEYGTLWFAANDDARLSRLEYVSGNRRPVAKAEADQLAGKIPLTVRFKGHHSIDYDGDSLVYNWKFDQAAKVQSHENNPIYTFTKPGIYDVVLEVVDPNKERSTSKIQIVAGNEPPQLGWQLIGSNQTFFLENQPLNISYEVAVNDAEDGSTQAGTIDENRVVLSFYYLPEGKDITAAVQDHQVLAENALALIGKNLMKNSDCKSCHQIADKSVGPTLKQIAEQYGKSPDRYTDYLVRKIINGGVGVWGETVMAAHPSISETEARPMVQYIFSLQENKKIIKYPLKGTYTDSQHIGKSNGDGAYVLTATYTDKGGRNVKSLTASETIVLRSAKVEIEDYDKGENAVKFLVDAANTPGVNEDMTVVVGEHDTWCMFEDIDLTGIRAISARCGLMPNITNGGKLNIRLGSPQGKKIGDILLEQKVTNYGINEYRTQLDPVSGKQNIYFTFASASPEIEGVVAVLDWVYFKK